MGLASVVWTVVAAQPGFGATRTPTIGVSVGSWSYRPMVLAVSGTWKVIVVSLASEVTPGAVTVTCAAADAAIQSPTMPSAKVSPVVVAWGRPVLT